MYSITYNSLEITESARNERTHTESKTDSLSTYKRGRFRFGKFDLSFSDADAFTAKHVNWYTTYISN